MASVQIELQDGTKTQAEHHDKGKPVDASVAISFWKNAAGKMCDVGFLARIVLLLVLHIWAVLASIHDFSKAQTLLVLLGILWVAFLYQMCGSHITFIGDSDCWRRLTDFATDVKSHRSTPILVCALVAICLAVFLAIDTSAERSRLFGLTGIVFFILLLTVLSTNRSKINWRTVIWGFFLQFCFGMISLRWKWGSVKFHQLADLIVQFLELTNKGTEFVFGFLAKPPPICDMAPVFVFTALQVLVFFSSVVSLLYYYGIIQWILSKLARVMQLTLGTTAVESLNACACVFLGQSEAALLIRPYLEKQTASELHAIMTSGFSCIAGSLFAAYVSFGACPKYLLSSTIMSAPGSLACSKIMFPEVEETQIKTTTDLELPPCEDSNPVECISNGAMAGMHLVVAIAANLVALLAFLGLVDSILLYFGDLIGQGPWSLESFMGYVMFPVAYLMGVTGDVQETLDVARLIGTKTAVNEFVAYKRLGELLSSKSHRISARSAMIATYALCGFSNFCSIGIFLGILGGLAPSKKHVLSKTIFRALLSGCVCCLYTATIAGIIVETPELCHPSDMAMACFNAGDMLNSTLSN